MSVLFLDFDGVLLDSAGETAITAWRGGRRLWSREWSGDYPPQWLIDSFRRVRPVLQTGYESFGLLRLAWLAGPEGSANLVPSAELGERASELLVETGVDRAELIELFGSTRDHWLRVDFQGWLEANRFYPGVIEAFRERLSREESNIYILTTKQERFVTALTEYVGLDLDPSRIFGLDTGKSKLRHLSELIAEDKWKNESLHFVEDRLAALLEAAEAGGVMDSLSLHLAEWGYVTGDDTAQARQHSRISPLCLDDFLELVRNGR